MVRLLLVLGFVALCTIAQEEPTGQDKYEINRLYYCKGPNLAIGSKCEGSIDCRSAFCAGQDIDDCKGTCRNRRADGQVAYKIGFMPQYESCVAGHGICGTCGEQVALEKPCTKAHQCRSGFCEGVRTDGCKGLCKATRPDGAEAYEVCRFRGKACTPDYDSCVSKSGICGICGKPNLVGQGCSANEECEEGSYCAPQGEGGPADCKGKCVRMREDEEEAYVAPWQPVKDWGKSDYKSCKSFKPEEKEPGHCGYCSANLLDLGQLCAFDADCEENLWCAGGGSDKLAAITLDRASCVGTCAACPVECGDYGCNIREGDAAILQCGMRTPQNTYFLPKVRVGIPILGQVQCFGVRTKKLVRLIEDDLTEDNYPYTMHISWNPKMKVKDPTKGRLPPTAMQAAEAQAVDDGVVASPKFDNCASIRKIRPQTLSTTGETDQGVNIVTHAVLTPKTGCVGIKYGLDGKFSVKLSHFHVKVKAAFEFSSPATAVTDGEYEMDVNPTMMKTLYYGSFMHGHLPMFVRIIAKPRISISVQGKIKPNRTFRLKWSNALVGDAAFSYSPEGSSFTNEMKLGHAGGDMAGARDQNPFEFFDILDGDDHATMWIRIGYQFTVEVNGMGFSLFPAIGGALRMKKQVSEGCNLASPKAVFNNVFEGKQVFMKTQILGLTHKPKCGSNEAAPEQFDTSAAMIKMCRDIGNFRYSDELVCHDEIINWALSVTTKQKLSTHLEQSCAAIVNRMKQKHKMVTTFPYHQLEDAKFSKPYWTYLVTMPDVGADAIALDCDPDAIFSTSGSINDVCVDLQDLRAVTPCERDPLTAHCHVSKIDGLTGVPGGAKVSKETTTPAPAVKGQTLTQDEKEPGPTQAKAKQQEVSPETTAAAETEPTLEEGEAPEEGDDEALTTAEAVKEVVRTPAPDNEDADIEGKEKSISIPKRKSEFAKNLEKQAEKILKQKFSGAKDIKFTTKEEKEVGAILEINGSETPTGAILLGMGIAILAVGLYVVARRSPKGLSYSLLDDQEV